MFAPRIEYCGSFRFACGGFGGDGTINGILNQIKFRTPALRYIIDGDAAALSALSSTAQILGAQPDANRLRRDGLQWVLAANGAFIAPVLSIHTRCDMYVWSAMQ